MLQQSTCPTCGNRNYVATGRHIKLTDEQIANIIRHDLSNAPKPSIKDFCVTTGISTYTYRIVAYQRVKQPADIQRISRIS